MNLQAAAYKLVDLVERATVAVGKAFAANSGYVEWPGPELDDRRSESRSEITNDASLDYLSGMAIMPSGRHAPVDVWCVDEGCLSYGDRVSPTHVHEEKR